MARTIGEGTDDEAGRRTGAPARFSGLSPSLAALAGALNARRAGLRVYQWLWMLLCGLVALAVAMPQVLSQPLIYVATAETRFDTGRYRGIYASQPVSDFAIAVGDASDALRLRYFQDRRDLRFGLPNFTVAFAPVEPGRVLVRGTAPTAAEARRLANEGAEELARQIRAAGGREILRNMLGWELWTALTPEGAPAPDPFDVLLRDILRVQAFPMSRAPEPISEPRRVEALTAEEQSDLTRALEARYELWRSAINTRNTTLDARCDTPAGLTTGQREALLETCAAGEAAIGVELFERNRAIERLRAIQAALTYMLNVQGTIFDADAPSAAHRVAAPLPAAPEPRRIGELLGLAVAFGLAFGAISVAVDRTAGVMAKLGELWQYRELIRNLVLRDMRARYKGSALGYLWTQLAPLLMMLVFWVVFGFFFQANLAMFPIFVIVALLPWNYCAEAVTGGSRSVIDNANLIKKVFFPREVLPIVSVFSSLLNYLLSLPMLFLVMAVVQLLYPPLREAGRLTNFSWTFAYLPVLLVIQTLFLTGVAFFFSALAVFFRDTVHLIGILVQLWFFLTPVVYTSTAIPFARLLRWLNPMASLIDFYREILYGNPVAAGAIPTPGLPALTSMLRVLVTALLVLALGYWFFERSSGRFGEEI